MTTLTLSELKAEFKLTMDPFDIYDEEEETLNFTDDELFEILKESYRLRQNVRDTINLPLPFVSPYLKLQKNYNETHDLLDNLIMVTQNVSKNTPTTTLQVFDCMCTYLSQLKYDLYEKTTHARNVHKTAINKSNYAFFEAKAFFNEWANNGLLIQSTNPKDLSFNYQ
jgi:hypothetical protein